MFSKHLFSALIGAAILTSCSRPVAYFQPSAREHFATSPSKATPSIAAENATPATTEVAIPVTSEGATEQVAQTNTALEQVDALVSNNTTLSADKTVQKRLNKVRTLLASASEKAPASTEVASAPKKMNLMERMMLKKMNKKINRQLAPANPDKAMSSQGTLAAGAVLVIIGLLLLILASGTASTIGLVAVLVGAVILLIGLL